MSMSIRLDSEVKVEQPQLVSNHLGMTWQQLSTFSPSAIQYQGLMDVKLDDHGKLLQVVTDGAKSEYEQPFESVSDLMEDLRGYCYWQTMCYSFPLPCSRSDCFSGF